MALQKQTSDTSLTSSRSTITPEHTKSEGNLLHGSMESLQKQVTLLELKNKLLQTQVDQLTIEQEEHVLYKQTIEDYSQQFYTTNNRALDEMQVLKDIFNLKVPHVVNEKTFNVYTNLSNGLVLLDSIPRLVYAMQHFYNDYTVLKHHVNHDNQAVLCKLDQQRELLEKYHAQVVKVTQRHSGSDLLAKVDQMKMTMNARQ